VRTHSFSEAATWADELYGSPNFLQFWFPESQFVEAERGPSWMSATRRDGDAVYGMGIGSEVQVNPRWTHFSISREAKFDEGALKNYSADGEWDAFVITTEKFAHLPVLENLKSDLGLVADFLEKNFPDASTKSDSDEVISWAGLRNESGKLVALGALSVWESDGLAAQSIAVDQDERGKGYGRQVVERMISTGFHLGFNSLCLGVWFYNTVAKNLYESIGFTRVESFIHYSQIDDELQRRNRPSRG